MAKTNQKKKNKKKHTFIYVACGQEPSPEWISVMATSTYVISLTDVTCMIETLASPLFLSVPYQVTAWTAGFQL